MKLLIYSHFFPPSVGGVETVVELLATGLGNLRTSDDLPAYKVTVVTNASASGSSEPCRPFSIVRNPSKRQLRDLIASCDIVHVAGVAIPPLREALRQKKPVVAEHHGFQAICPNGQLLKEPEDAPCPGYFMQGNHSKCLKCRKSGSRFVPVRLWLLTFLRRRLCERVDANIVPTRWLGEQLGLPRVKIVAHGIPPRAPIVRISGNEKTLRIVFIGRLVTTKGVGLLLQAARQLKMKDHNLRLWIIGTGPERELLEIRVKEWDLGDQVKFFGFIPEEEINKLLAEATVIVVPSMGGEVFGMVVAENMSRGLPVLASDLGAFAEVLGGTDQTFRTGDADDLARQLLRLLRDSTLAGQWAKAGHERATKTLTAQRMIEGHDQVYRDVLTSRVRSMESCNR